MAHIVKKMVLPVVSLLLLSLGGMHCQIQCEESRTVQSSTTVTSTNYDELEPKLPCRKPKVTLTSPPGSTMTVSCSDVNISCRNLGTRPYIQIFNGGESKYYCGGPTLPNITSVANSMEISHYSILNYFFSWKFFTANLKFKCDVMVNSGGGSSSSSTTTTIAPPPPSGMCDCGTRKLISSDKIVGGRNAEEGEFPYQASMQRFGRHICGGSLISNRWVVTAVHCEIRSSDKVKLGEHSRSSSSPNEKSYDIETVVNHEDYDSRSLKFDIALVRLAQNVVYTDYIRPICLPDNLLGENFVDKFLDITGWGATSEGGAASNILKAAVVDGISNTACRAVGGDYASDIFPQSICALRSGTDTCQGDSGGPLAYRFGGLSYLIGVTSWGFGCARPDFPGVYLRVSHSTVLSWVKTTAGITCTAPSGIRKSFRG